MTYTVLARRYRSQSFNDVVGQQPIARTLRNAIANKRVAHAYLFCGTRGVGKTSLARIFARALNAPDTVEDSPKPADGSDLPPRDVQDRMAEAIMRGDDLNVIEIDGASNNSVEQARQLIANAGLSPTANARYKIYIIDEVHMLSGAAFNALLKTMEEPPAHVKFILCTTEPHKVPATIQSRCQRFDFRNIPTTLIAQHLKNVVDQEKVSAEEDMLWQVARLGNGSMRDSLSLLDRLIATSENQQLTRQSLEQMLGLPDQQVIDQLIVAMANGDIGGSLQKVNELLSRGISQDQLVDVLIEHFRQLMLLSACGPESELVELSDEAKKEATRHIQQFDAPALVYMIWLCENLQRAAKSSSNPRAILDATIVRLALAEKMADVSALLSTGGSQSVDSKKKLTPANRPVSGEDCGRSTARSVGPATTNTVIAPGVGDSLSKMVDTTDPALVWSSLRQHLADRPAFAWVDHLQLTRLENGNAYLSPTPGHREVIGFANEARRKQLASHLAELIRQPVRIIIQPNVQDGEEASQQVDVPSDRVDTNDAMRQLDRRTAMSLPLVKKVLDIFPDATLLSAQKQGDDRH